MKKALFPAMLLLATFNSFSQDLTGTWDGVFYDQRNPNLSHASYLFLEVKQTDRAVWGAFHITSSYNINAPGCLCSVNAILPKKSNSTALFYKDHVVNQNINGAGFTYCNSINGLDARYILQDNTEYLIGRWFGVRLSGYFILRHIKSNTSHDIDSYFPNLKRLIAQGAKGIDKNTSTPVIIADTTKPLYDEQRLIDALKNARIKGGKE